MDLLDHKVSVEIRELWELKGVPDRVVKMVATAPLDLLAQLVLWALLVILVPWEVVDLWELQELLDKWDDLEFLVSVDPMVAMARGENLDLKDRLEPKARLASLDQMVTMDKMARLELLVLLELVETLAHAAPTAYRVSWAHGVHLESKVVRESVDFVEGQDLRVLLVVLARLVQLAVWVLLVLPVPGVKLDLLVFRVTKEEVVCLDALEWLEELVSQVLVEKMVAKEPVVSQVSLVRKERMERKDLVDPLDSVVLAANVENVDPLVRLVLLVPLAPLVLLALQVTCLPMPDLQRNNPRDPTCILITETCLPPLTRSTTKSLRSTSTSLSSRFLA